MTVEENKNIVRRWIAARNANDLDAALAEWVEEWHERLTVGFNSTTNALPDVNIMVEDLFGEDDKVALSWTMTGTHSGVYEGIPATQKPLTRSGIDIYTIENGKIKSIVRKDDKLDLLKRMGITLAWEGKPIP